MICAPDAFVPYGSGRRTEPGALKDAALAASLVAYKRQVARRYRILDPEGLERALPKGQLWVSTKIDGELWFLVKKAGEVALCAYNGRVLEGIPATDEAATLLASTDDCVIAGELFAVLGGESRPRCHHVAKALADPECASSLFFQAFDLVEDAGASFQGRTYAERLERLNGLLANGKKAGVVITTTGDAAVAAGCYREWVATGKFEGLVVRSEQGVTFKVKPTFTLDAVVLAWGERVEGAVAQLRELTVGLLRDDGAWHILGSVGGGFTEDDRVAWQRRLSALEVPSSFRLANREGTLCRFAEPKLVVEVRCHDLVDTDSSDLPVQRVTLRYQAGKGYSPVAPMPIGSMIFPLFLRERADKLPDAACVGLDQIYARLPFESRFEAASAKERSSAQIVHRAVFTKATKGLTAVRKVVALSTNKADDPAYPPFVAHFTDYSAGRAEPLKTTLRVASTREKLERHVQAWLEENVKRGWSEVKRAEEGARAPASAAAPVPATGEMPTPEPGPETPGPGAAPSGAATDSSAEAAGPKRRSRARPQPPADAEQSPAAPKKPRGRSPKSGA